MREAAGEILNVTGRSIDMTMTGFIPGKTPTAVPKTAPRRQ